MEEYLYKVIFLSHEMMYPQYTGEIVCKFAS